MKKKLGLLLATVIVMNTLCSISLASTSPLEKYNLYDDVMGGGNSSANQDRERATQDFYNNSMRPGENNASSEQLTPEEQEAKEDAVLQKKKDTLDSVLNSIDQGTMVGPRNKALRESSRNVYSNPTEPDPWASEISFYSNPKLANVREKYRQSNFAGALQECISLVNHKNFATMTNEYKTIAFYYMAMCYTKCGQASNAVRAYERVITLNDCPMIVKYATNGRNCVLPSPKESDPNAKESDANKCYLNVNVPELVYPNAHIADTLTVEDLTPIDPNTLINKNMKKFQMNLPTAIQTATTLDGQPVEEVPLNLPFGKQDAELDKFINAPYGNGLSPKFNEEYRQIQLRTIKKKMNAEAGVKEPEEPVEQPKAEEEEATGQASPAWFLNNINNTINSKTDNSKTDNSKSETK